MILIGDGIPFFEKLVRDIALHLAEVKAYKSGTVELRYELRGPRRVTECNLTTNGKHCVAPLMLNVR